MINPKLFYSGGMTCTCFFDDGNECGLTKNLVGTGKNSGTITYQIQRCPSEKVFLRNTNLNLK
ncbi:MAG: hypothetical protein SGI98_12025 [Verrucomicrobiota bacterium]|nr:hypothetical protein [Verrucomicrobiota bacterium]